MVVVFVCFFFGVFFFGMFVCLLLVDPGGKHIDLCFLFLIYVFRC